MYLNIFAGIYTQHVRDNLVRKGPVILTFRRWISGAALDGEIHPARDARYVSLLVA